MKWYNAKINWRAAAWTLLILIGVRIAFQIRDGGWTQASGLLLVDVILLVAILRRRSSNPN